MLAFNSTIRLSSGIEMPRLGLGTYRLGSGGNIRQVIDWALEIGYRHFDTAAAYGNEEEIGRALASSGIAREKLFIVTKVANDSQGYEQAAAACEASLKRLGLEYIDLYLVHWPVRQLRGETWQALIRLYEQGKCRAIGVSNYTVRHLQELLPATPVHPAVNQVEISPFWYRKALLEYCQAQNIPVIAYGPLARARKLENPRLAAIAAAYQKTAAQVAIRWSLQHGMAVIPKTSQLERLRENANVFDFEIQPADMASLDQLNEDYSIIPPALNPETSPEWL